MRSGTNYKLYLDNHKLFFDQIGDIINKNDYTHPYKVYFSKLEIQHWFHRSELELYFDIKTKINFVKDLIKK